MENEYVEDLTSLPKTANMSSIQRAYEEDVQDAYEFVEELHHAAQQRNCQWPNKSRSQRKEYKNAKPWIGASDQEVPLIEYAIDTRVAICMNAYDSGSFQAMPVGSDDIERSGVTSQFLRWQLDSNIPNARNVFEFAANSLDEKRMAITYIGWDKRKRRHEEEFTIEDIAQVSPELAEMLMDDSTPEEDVFELFRTIPNVVGIPEKKARRAIKDFRKTGVAKIPVAKGDINRPILESKDPLTDVILPYYTTDPQRASRVHVRFVMNAADLMSMVDSEDWDKDFVDEVIDNYMGMTSTEFDGAQARRWHSSTSTSSTAYGLTGDTAEDLVIIVRTYQRFVDPEDGAQAIYETVWCPKMGAEMRDGSNAYAKFGILNGWDEYPLVFTRYKEANKRWYDVRGLVESLQGTQRYAKVSRDGSIDGDSLSNSPPRTHRAGAPVQRWGADADIPIRRGDEGLYKYLEVPERGRINMDRERYLDEEADRYAGLTEGSNIALQKQQHMVNRFMSHVAKCSKMVYKAHQRYGDDEVHFRVTGQPDPIVFAASPYEEELDVKFVFDVKQLNPEYVSDTLQALTALKQEDTTGRLDPDALMDIKVQLLVPHYAGRILRTSQAAQADIQNKVAEDISKIQAKIPINADPQGAKTALQFLQQYESQEDVQAQLQQDIGFAQRYGAYKEQYLMQLEQQRNAMIGRNVNPDAMVQSAQ